MVQYYLQVKALLDKNHTFGRIGAVLRILGGCNFVDDKALRRFLLSCQYKVLQSLVIFDTMCYTIKIYVDF